MRNLKRRVLSARNNKTRDCEINYVYSTQDMGGYVTCVKHAWPLFSDDTRETKKHVTKPYLYRVHWFDTEASIAVAGTA